MQVRISSIVALFCFLLVPLISAAQPTRPLLTEVLQELALSEGHTLSYDAALLSKVTVNPELKERSWEYVLDYLPRHLPLEVLDLGDRQFVLKTRRASFTLMLLEGLAQVSDTTLIASIFVNTQPLASSRDKQQLHFDYQPVIGDTLLIQVLGYELYELPAAQLLEQLQAEVNLQPIEVQLSGLIVQDYITKGININPSNQQISIATGQLPLLPGETDGDIFSSLSAIPGISTPDNRAGNIYIRGSSTDQTLILYEDIPIYHRGHYFGTISPYNPQVIEEVNVSRSGFDPSLGGRVGGTIEINTASPTQEDSRLGLATNTLYGSGFIKIPSKSIGLSFGARKSYPVGFQSPKLAALNRVIFDASAVNTDSIDSEDLTVSFEDYQLGIFREGKNYELSITGIYTTSTIAYPMSINGEDENLTRNGGANVKWKYAFTPDLSNQMGLTVSDYYFGFNNRLNSFAQLPPNRPDSARGPGGPGGGPPDQPPPMQTPNESVRYEYSVNQIFDVKWGDRVIFQSSSGDEWHFGVDLQYQSVRINYQDYPNESLDSVMVEPVPERINEKVTALTSAGYFNYQVKRFPRLYAQVGARVEHYSLTGEWRIAPRIFASYDINDDFTLKSSLGRYYQYLSQIQVLQFATGGFTNQLWQLADGDEISTLQGDMLMLGALFQKRKWIIDIETYAREIRGVNYFNTLRLAARLNRGVETFFYQADQTFIGLDLSLKRSVNKYLSLWMGYSFMDASLRIVNGDFGPRRVQGLMPKYSQPHVIYIGQSLERDRFKLSAGWRYASGLSTRSPEYRLADAVDPENALLLPDRYRPVHWLDISASYVLPKAPKRKFQTTFGLSLVNVYNQENVTDEVQRVLESTVTLPIEDRIRYLDQRNAIMFAPNLSITMEW